MTAPFRIEVLAGHDRSSFDCGEVPLNDYLQKRARKDMRRNVSVCYLAIENETGSVAGYYTLAAGSIRLSDLPDRIVKKLPRYPNVPVALLGRLGIDTRYQGKRLGGALLVDATRRCTAASLGIYAMVVDAKSDQAAAFYEHLGFQWLTREPMRLFLPISDGLKGILR